MHSIVLLLWLVVIGAIALAVLAIIAGFVAGRCRLAAVLVLVYGPLVVLGYLKSSIQEHDVATERPVTADGLTGTYHLDQSGSRAYLATMGYRDFTAQITLNSNGKFTGIRIPACCIHGDDESRTPFTGGYYRLSGTWTVQQKSSGAYGVKLDIKTAEVSDRPRNNDVALLVKRMAGHRNVDAALFKGAPRDLAFKIYTGSDFNYIGFRRKET